MAPLRHKLNDTGRNGIEDVLVNAGGVIDYFEWVQIS